MGLNRAVCYGMELMHTITSHTVLIIKQADWLIQLLSGDRYKT